MGDSRPRLSAERSSARFRIRPSVKSWRLFLSWNRSNPGTVQTRRAERLSALLRRKLIDPAL